MSHDEILAEYLIEMPYSAEFAASVIASEQSSGTFVKLLRETPELQVWQSARIESVKFLETTETLSPPGVRGPHQPAATADLMYLAGGIKEIQQAWEAALLGIPLQPYALDHPELQHSIEKFGKPA